MPEADILILSDIHLGSPVSRSKELLVHLKKLRFVKLILNGDVFDDLDFTRLSHDDWELFSYFRELTGKNHGHDVVWIAGNHDGAARTLSHLIGIPVVNEYLFEWNGKRCLAIHGHQFDRFLNKNIILSALASMAYLLIQRIDTRNQRFARFVKRMSKAWLRLSEKVANGATWYGKFLKRADIVFCGHTHLALHKEVNGVDYWNSGCWTDIPSTYITVRGEKIEIHMVG